MSLNFGYSSGEKEERSQQRRVLHYQPHYTSISSRLSKQSIENNIIFCNKGVEKDLKLVILTPCLTIAQQ